MSNNTVIARFSVNEVKHLKSVAYQETQYTDEGGMERVVREPVLGENGRPVLQTHAIEVSCFPVFTPDPKSDNYAFAVSTPSGRLDMTIRNPAVFDWFIPGTYLDVEMKLHKPETQ